MRKTLLFSSIFMLLLVGCKKNKKETITQETNISDNAIIVSNTTLINNLILVDSTKLVFNGAAEGLDKIKVGSILVSDITPQAPYGFLRKVSSLTKSNGQLVCTTVNASLTDVIINGNAKFTKTFTDSDILGVDTSGVDIAANQRTQSLSFNFNFSYLLYDADGNNSTTEDQIILDGEMLAEPTVDYDIDIKNRKLNYFHFKLIMKNTCKIVTKIKTKIPYFKEEIVLKTFYLKPFTIPVYGVPVPMAKQWVVIVLGIDGSITAKLSTGVQNINTSTSGVVYENGSYKTFSNQENSFSILPVMFDGKLKAESFLQVRYEMRPYALSTSRFFIGLKGSVISEIQSTPPAFKSIIKWGVKFNAKAQAQIFDQNILDYEAVFYEKEFPVYEATIAAFPTISTADASEITSSTAKTGGDIISDGGAQISSRGIIWSTSPNPNYAVATKTQDGSGSGSFVSNLVGLLKNTTYYVRAYAINSAGIGYGNEITFTTSNTTINTPTLTTSSISSITNTSSISGGNISSDGGAPVSARGVCWSTSQNPTIANSKSSNGSGTGLFSSSITNLSPGTTYYVRAYATNSIGTAYGSQVSFTTSNVTYSLPDLTTATISNITSSSAISGGNISSDGGASVTARGVCWSTTQNPTTSNSKTTDGNGTGSFSSAVGNLSPNTTYYIRAYAINSQGTSYGNQLNFTTPSTSTTLPTLSTTNISSITTTSAISGGNITSDGGTSVTSRGICWSTSQNPTTSNSKSSDGSGNGAFSSSIIGLISNTTYYVRAYATNSNGTAYGNQVSFQTQSESVANLPSVVIGSQTWTNKNLDVTTYRNGDQITYVTNASQWASMTTGAWCYYNFDPANNNTYGKLYNWYAVNDPRGIAPNGWHVASNEEWATLINYLGTSSAGGKLKAVSSLWQSPNSGATNSTGFTGLPGGYYRSGTFVGIGTTCFFWTTTAPYTDVAWYRGLIYNRSDVYDNGMEKAAGQSVRLVKN